MNQTTTVQIKMNPKVCFCCWCDDKPLTLIPDGEFKGYYLCSSKCYDSLVGVYEEDEYEDTCDNVDVDLQKSINEDPEESDQDDDEENYSYSESDSDVELDN